MQPIDGVYKDGMSGLIKGVGKGMIGVVTKPFGSAIDLIAQTSQRCRTLYNTRLIISILTTTVGNNETTRKRNAKYRHGVPSHFRYRRLLEDPASLLMFVEAKCITPTVSTSYFDGIILVSFSSLYIVAEEKIQTTVSLSNIARVEESLRDKELVVVVTKGEMPVRFYFNVSSMFLKSQLIVILRKNIKS
jgi:hypothetical protein